MRDSLIEDRCVENGVGGVEVIVLVVALDIAELIVRSPWRSAERSAIVTIHLGTIAMSTWWRLVRALVIGTVITLFSPWYPTVAQQHPAQSQDLENKEPEIRRAAVETLTDQDLL